MNSGLKSVLCFGDSNTWGYMPIKGGRYPTELRWTSLLEQQLPADWQVINEGLPGRTTGFMNRFTALTPVSATSYLA
ncbi:arylesterase [Vibrio ponticus]|nr:arylesterase [Vibrio ponticus]